MLQTKQSAFDTFETLRNIETISSRIHQIKYNINDYLPNDNQYKPTQILQIYRRDDFQIMSSKCRADDVQSEYENGYKQLIASLQQEIKQKDCKIQKLVNQLQLRQLQYERNIRKANQQLNEVNQKLKKLEKIHSSNIQKITVLQQAICQQKKQKQLINDELNEIKKQQIKRIKNIRIFCQKYEIIIEPKIKQTYTIEVQTQKQIQLKLDKFEQQIPNYSKMNENEGSNRKISCHSKPQFYQLYQQHQQNDLNQLQAQFTTKSQIISSGYKPKKPAFIYENVSEFTDKENDRKKINQRIDGKSWVSTKQKNKVKIKNQEIQIYPIDENHVEDIVNGILGII